MSKDKHLKDCLKNTKAAPTPLSAKEMLALKGGDGNTGTPPPPPPVTGTEDIIIL
ncbi:hypothetical protein [Lewinella sp. LCG006]|uniref:hypothetical protein n=1 Tax=Lewinella sp. LCG006 TaxID=3231911 RepID=UPI00345F683B